MSKKKRSAIGDIYSTYCDHCLVGFPICVKCIGCTGCGKHIHHTSGWCSKECKDMDYASGVFPLGRSDG